MRMQDQRTGPTYPLFKLSTWDARSMTWREARAIFATEAAARAAGERRKGAYRVSRRDGSGWADVPAGRPD